MTELEVMRILGIVSAIAVILPFASLALKIYKISGRRSIVFVDREGNVVKEITADSVSQIDTDELVHLHDRIRRKHDITISTRAA